MVHPRPLQDELAGKAAARTLDALLQSVTCLRMGGRDVLDGADTPRPGIEWAGYDREFEEADVAEQRDVEPRGRIWILPPRTAPPSASSFPGTAGTTTPSPSSPTSTRRVPPSRRSTSSWASARAAEPAGVRRPGVVTVRLPGFTCCSPGCAAGPGFLVRRPPIMV